MVAEIIKLINCDGNLRNLCRCCLWLFLWLSLWAFHYRIVCVTSVLPRTDARKIYGRLNFSANIIEQLKRDQWCLGLIFPPHICPYLVCSLECDESWVFLGGGCWFDTFWSQDSLIANIHQEEMMRPLSALTEDFSFNYDAWLFRPEFPRSEMSI